MKFGRDIGKITKSLVPFEQQLSMPQLHYRFHVAVRMNAFNIAITVCLNTDTAETDGFLLVNSSLSSLNP